MRRLKTPDGLTGLWAHKLISLLAHKPINLLAVFCLLCIASFPCISQTGDDQAAIRELFLTFERGFEGRDVEKYVSVFSDSQGYEYVSDVTTPDDPSDDIHLLGAQSERKAAVRIFKTYENIDLEMTDPEITINGNSAEVRNTIELVIVAFEKPYIPSIYYAVSSNTFSVRKVRDEWKIVRWQQHESSREELAARDQEERKDKGVDDLIRDLGDDRPRIWAAAMVDLRKASGANVATRHAVSLLIDAVAHNPNKNVRIRAAKVLAGTQDEDAVQALMEVLENEEGDVDVRVAAASALSECDSHEVDRSLSTAAKGNEPKLKSATSLALARRIRKEMDDVYRVAVTALQHEDEAVREAAVESLGVMLSMRGASLLEQRFKDKRESENVRLAALESLKIYGRGLTPPLQSESLLHLFREALKDRKEAEQIRIHAARALIGAKDRQVSELLADVAKSKREFLELRKEAIAALGTMDNSKAVKPLVSLLNSSDADLRREAARSLEKLGDRRALKPLVVALMNRDEDIFVRRLAGGGIVRIDRDIAFGPLVQIMNDETESAPARRMAAEKLVSMGDDRSLPPFIEVLENEQQPWWLRRIAANHLKNSGNSIPCIDALKTAAGDADERIAKIAQDALGKVDPKLSASP